MLTVLSLLLSMLVQAPEGGAVPVRESVRRASHIYHLTKFVEWPETAFDGAQAPLTICVYADPVDAPIRALEGWTAQGRTIADVANNGLEALAAFEDRNYDVVLMDLQMPELDGIGVTRELRRILPKERQPRIVAMTANASERDRELCLESGMDDFVSKPVSVKALASALERSSEDPKLELPSRPTTSV